MNKSVMPAVFAVGLAAVGWVGWGFVGTSPLALAMTAVIGAVYVLGAYELWQFRAATQSLGSALTDGSAGPAPLADLNVELFSTGDDAFLLRAGDEMWQLETRTCSQLPEPSDNVQAQPIGVFHMDAKKKLVFEPAEGSVAAAR